jgi:hypothetical protein
MIAKRQHQEDILLCLILEPACTRVSGEASMNSIHCFACFHLFRRLLLYPRISQTSHL